jgi:hypothetical protein
MSEENRVSRFFQGSRLWLSRASHEVAVGSEVVASESDRWFLGALRGLEEGAVHAQRGVDALVNAAVGQWIRRRPSWMRPRTSRERIQRTLQAEAKRHGFDVEQDAFRSFSGKIAILLELVYTGAVPLDAIAFEPGENSGDCAEALQDSAGDPSTDRPDRA